MLVYFRLQLLGEKADEYWQYLLRLAEAEEESNKEYEKKQQEDILTPAERK